MRLCFHTLAIATIAGISMTACGGPEYVRGSQDPSIDSHAMSTGLDKEDIQHALKETLNKLRAAPIMNQWRTTNPPPTVAIFPFQNSTSEHIDSALDTILNEAESWMVESNVVTMVSRERQTQMIRDVEGQQNPVFNQAHVAQYGKQLGVKYYITGKVSGDAERTEDMRRVQYFLYLQVIEVETSAIRFQGKTEITKAVR
jgi:penicillin-binding protein activator